MMHDGVQQPAKPKVPAMRFFTSYRSNIVAPYNFHDVSDGTSKTVLFAR